MKNTEECANIYLVSVQNSGGTLSKTEIRTSGGFYKRDGNYFVTYTEDADAGMGKSQIFLKISEDGVTMRRMGEFKTIMRYIEGEITDFSYMTPFGKMKMKIKTEKIVNELYEKGGVIKMFYTLFAGDEGVETEIALEVEQRSEK